ncbi:hypothetical protein [Marinobacter oulmenensis]|uniref:Clp amino terminal domain-containing protein, pathogenicity island component n=1 Tax=Marinobacter oulmenensis TaxID=643747 RepID=A0A840UNC0_9GAMM|nr:hypothetical protein [Marinobacter oulmenensis]MBB5322576.1 hypothetical protein [Marinobacter oulmenensis]
MEDWQACLAPECQAALRQARESVLHRGGAVVTVEDFLLALLDTAPGIIPFLRSESVDIDELVRTIQGEQPLVTEVHNEGQLSSQLLYWISRAREITGAEWLNWLNMLRTLACCCERLQDKAYVAVLELVQSWPEKPASMLPEAPDTVPIALTDPAWLMLAEDLAVTLTSDPSVLVWVTGPEGSGKTSWLQVLRSAPGFDSVSVNPRHDTSVRDCVARYVESGEGVGHWPVLVLDQVSPSDLLELMVWPGSAIARLLAQWGGPVLALGRHGFAREADYLRLARMTGRQPEIIPLPSSSRMQCRSILSLHQPVIEKRWNLQLRPDLLDHVAAVARDRGMTPGIMLKWLCRAAARHGWLVVHGTSQSQMLEARHREADRQALVALARGATVQHEPLSERRPEQLEGQRTEEPDTLSLADLEEELQRLLAAGPHPVHYDGFDDQEQGDTSGAGSGNLYS